MRISIYIFLFIITIPFYSQNSNYPNIEFKNELDEIKLGMKISDVKNELGKSSSRTYSWMSFDLGGPRIFYHYWDYFYSKNSSFASTIKLPVYKVFLDFDKF